MRYFCRVVTIFHYKAIEKYMKKILLPLALVGLFACNSNKVEEISYNTPYPLTTFEELEDTIKDMFFQGEIKFNDVSFKYPFDDFDVIKNINITIKSGETIGIVGPTGSGKSTLVRQLLREFNVTKGKILIDDIPIEEYMIEDVRNMVGYVPQEHVLFSRSVLKNVLIGDSKATEEDINNNILQGFRLLLVF